MQAILVCGDQRMDRVTHAIFLEHELKMDSIDGLGDSTSRKLRPVPEEPHAMRIEALIQQLFNMQDVNADGVLEEAEFALLNDSVLRLRKGKALNYTTFGTPGRALFRGKLDKFGRPVPYVTFRKYVLRVLQELDVDEAGQELLLQQFLAEARRARGVGLEQFYAESNRARCMEQFTAEASKARGSGMVRQSIAKAPYLPVAPRRINFIPAMPCRVGFNVSRDPMMAPYTVAL
jgi:hypothetical protein